MTADLLGTRSPRHPVWCHPRCPAAASGLHSSRPIVVGSHGDDHRLRIRVWAHAHLPDPVPQVEIVVDGGDHHVRVDLDLGSTRTLVARLAELLATVPTGHRVQSQQHRVVTP